jgi:23S rRNA pseudouridine2605 synthase
MTADLDDDDSTSDATEELQGVRLQRFLASTGLGSRRRCEEFITAGRVSIDGEIKRDLGTRVDPRRQRVMFDGQAVRQEPLRYFLLNKPRGYLCTNSDPSGRPLAIDLIPAGKLRLFTVGRLDESSEGLILVTNDGELAHRLAHPRFQVPRTYAVQVAGRPTPEILTSLRDGMFFHEGRFRLKWVRRTGSKGNSAFLEVGLDHGQNREIRRLFARVGHKVMRLKRIAFGPLSLNKLSEGRFRPLTGTELKEIRDMLGRPRRRKAAGESSPRPTAKPRSGRPKRAKELAPSPKGAENRTRGRRRRSHE